MGVPKRQPTTAGPKQYTKAFGVVLTEDQGAAVTEASAKHRLSKAEIARQAIEVWLDPRLSDLADSFGTSVREVLWDAVEQYVTAQQTPPTRKRRVPK